ncbi:MAG: glutathione S-transferase family protein [Deltaproteobacteria bacterium]|nr:glutathione S-transferase family protein [Deltaproteobacteria bacterium]
MTKLKLSYFDAPVSRGEECRLALHVAGLAFEDERLSRDAWNARKASAPFGALPILWVEGKGEIAQSNAILNYLGHTQGLLPKDPFEAARHDALLNAVEDLRNTLRPINRLTDAEAKKAARIDFAKGYMQEWGAQIERQIGPGPFAGGAQIGVADLKIFVAVGTFIAGGIDHIPADVFKAFPKLTALHDAVKAHPKVAEWRQKHR